MDTERMERMKNGAGFIAALDQSGGSTPKALRAYGIDDSAYSTDDEMFKLVHDMRTRIITNPAFTCDRILAAILFEKTMDDLVDGKYTGDYLWEEKGILPILKIDKGLMDEADHVKLMKPIPDLEKTLEHALKDRNIFGTKERSVILDYDKKGIEAIIDQQFELGLRVWACGLVPILEPEVDIHAEKKAEAEDYMKEYILKKLSQLDDDVRFVFKVTIPTVPDNYREIMDDPHVLRVVALSGGYTQEEANDLLRQNHGLIASFSRALAEHLRFQQSDEEFTEALDRSIQAIFEASET